VNKSAEGDIIMLIKYKDIKHFNKAALEELFLSVSWESGKYPKELQIAMLNSHAVISAWDGENLVGLINALSDNVMTVYFHYMLVHPQYQFNGVGTKMMTMMLEKYQNFKTKFLVSYESSEKFYERFDYKPVEKTTALYITEIL
jgi:GNAT superfamily N-acetyltransferase